MKVLILLSLVAVCFSQTTFTGRQITVRPDDTIILRGELGKELEIIRNPISPRSSDFILRSPFRRAQQFHAEDIRSFRNDEFNILDSRLPFRRNLGDELSQHDILVSLFKQYQGIILDEDRFTLLLQDIYNLVKNGELNPSVWTILNYFDKLEPKDEQWESQYLPQEFGLEQYGLQSAQKWSPLQRLNALLQQNRYNQGLNEEQRLYQSYRPEYQTIFEKYERPYEQYQLNPLSRFIYNLKQQQQQQLARAEQITSYQRGFQQEYPQINEFQQQQRIPQTLYPQQLFNVQRWGIPQQYQRQEVPESWQQVGYLGRQQRVY